MEAFTVLVLRYLDRAASAEEAEQLKAALAGSAAHRELFVQVCRTEGDLYELCAPKRAALRRKEAKQAEPVLVSAKVQSAAGTSRAAGSSDPQAPGRRQSPAPDLREEPESAAEAPSQPAGADTVLGELSGEDTVHRRTKPPGQ